MSSIAPAHPSQDTGHDHHGGYGGILRWVATDERLGKLHFWLTLISFNMIFLQHFLGLAGMPRRIPDYPLRRGEKAPQLPWEGADSLEWTHLPTPAPYHSFETPPEIP